MPLATIEEAIEAYARGEFLVVVDDEDRENEGDLIIAADAMTMEKMNFMIRYTSGVICAPMSDERADQLDLSLMVVENTESMKTAFTVSVDLIGDTTTGISAADRSATVKALADLDRIGTDFARPGHIFPLRARKGGVLKRAGHTEAAVDLCAMADRPPVGVLSEIVNEDGTMARVPELEKFAEEHNLLFITIADLIRHRRRNEKLVEHFAEARIPTKHGEFAAHAYRSVLDEIEHVAYVLGDIENVEEPLVRVHSECLTGDLLGSIRCDCGSQLDSALEIIGEEGSGVIVYLRGHEGRGIGIGHKLRAYKLQDDGLDTVDANLQQGLPIDSREYGVGAQILADLGISKMRLMTNNPVKYGGLEGYGLDIVGRIPLRIDPNDENIRYLQTKKERLGHDLSESNEETESA
ncbi:MAG: bifunctional 3,4-dihydroxy-2-butanone-4-phosphate synthase/GTP cyclohydrolase II [Acidimicrobiaceae bacterium]|jgi:3,4-dihydroxy 2-butanone 4-phosphate synthase/GTP cyclohydrolase II|nr:bifunctional 3,4-dihydroxy-2-butanone-4-phosphate synthase/GTP cyclohydrolase II [Acidimicrobiaceae bacterium]|tara:strand:- start:2651 stop:3877 length:1227 start_codon:yes stop_codon:yes gene_type:complete